MNLPPELGKIIQDYARPLTRSDWKTCGKFKHSSFIKALKKKYTYSFIAYYNNYYRYIISFRMQEYGIMCILN